MSRESTITGNISPKSIVASGTGLFFAQNMMYQHTVTVYDRGGQLVKTIPDSVRLADFGFPEHAGEYQGAPVETAFAPASRYAYVSNYSMYGPGFGHPGDDTCSPSMNIDQSYLYRIDVVSLAIDRVIAVGSVPKFVAVTPDDRYVLASNWCSYDLSVVDTRSNTEIKRIPLGAYPRGIAVDPGSRTAYVAVMGTSDVAKLDLATFDVGWIRNVGSGPRHVVVDPVGRYLYVTLNAENRVAKIDLATDEVVARVSTGTEPRSMTIAADGLSLYVVNYGSGTVSKLRTSDMSVLQTVPTNAHPIGITYDALIGKVWVACYSGSIVVFHDA